nr:MAG TPA: hypothetical protein [Caudoviricetes sp.]
MGHACERTEVDTQAGGGSRTAEIAGPESQGSDCREIYFRAKDNTEGRAGIVRGSLSASRAVVTYGGKNPAIRTFSNFPYRE